MLFQGEQRLTKIHDTTACLLGGGYLSELHPFSGVAWLRTCSNMTTLHGPNALPSEILFIQESLPVHHLFADATHGF